MKRVFCAILTVLLALGIAAAPAYAGHGGWGKGHMGLEGKLFSKIHFIMMNSKELGLSEQQEEAVKELKFATKKDIVMKKAEIDVVALDIKMHMYGDKIDTAAVDKLIDKKYDLKKAKAKVLVGAYAGLKDILKKEQMDKMKDLWQERDKG